MAGYISTNVNLNQDDYQINLLSQVEAAWLQFGFGKIMMLVRLCPQEFRLIEKKSLNPYKAFIALTKQNKNTTLLIMINLYFAQMFQQSYRWTMPIHRIL